MAGRLWIIIAILIPAALFLLAAAVIAVFYGAPIEWPNTGRSTEFPELPRLTYWLANVFFYGFGEEVGWRGFALPRLQSHISSLRASLLLAIAWAGWHLPLFAFSPGIPFTFSPESCSPSPRNVFHVPAGIAFTLPRNPQLGWG